jgi:hypothetical protein
MEPLVLGIFLKVETRGFSGPAPVLLKEPLRSESGPEAYRLFVYDFSPKEEGLTVSDATQRLASRLARLFAPEHAPFPEGHYALRLKLEIGLIADASAGSISYAWPLDFLQALGDAGIELNVSHYLPSPDTDDEDDDADY